jgi:hypothetical protein
VNKGLEVIEAHWLYDVDYDVIDVAIHPQSVVHSAVRFVDGSLKAQLGTPDMRLPIQYALTYPDRLPSPAEPADLVAAGRLEFLAPDEGRFPALRIARAAGRTGSRASTALIAADEVAVARFLDGTLDFPGIPRLLEEAVTRFGEGADRRPISSRSLPSTPRSGPPSPRRVATAVLPGGRPDGACPDRRHGPAVLPDPRIARAVPRGRPLRHGPPRPDPRA